MVMSLLCWNTRCLCSYQWQNELEKLLRERRIKVFGVVETKLSKSKREDFTQLLSEEWGLISNVIDEGTTERDLICMGWKRANWAVTVLFTHQQAIHCSL